MVTVSRLIILTFLSVFLAANASDLNDDQVIQNEITLKKNLISRAAFALRDRPQEYANLLSAVESEVEKHRSFLGQKLKHLGLSNTDQNISGYLTSAAGSGLILGAHIYRSTGDSKFRLFKNKSTIYIGVLLFSAGLYAIYDAHDTPKKALSGLTLNPDYDLSLNKVVDGLYLLHKGNLSEKMLIKNSFNKHLKEKLSRNLEKPILSKIMNESLQELYEYEYLGRFYKSEHDMLKLTVALESNINNPNNSDPNKLKLVDSCLDKIYVILTQGSASNSNELNNLIESIEDVRD